MTRGGSNGDWRRGHLTSLRGFCHVAQLGSMTKAAELVDLSQPSISLQIQALERELKVTLFQRKGPRITLTPEGQALYKLAWPLIEALDGLPAAFQASRQGLETGRLNIAAGESTILYILPEPVRAHLREEPRPVGRVGPEGGGAHQSLPSSRPPIASRTASVTSAPSLQAAQAFAAMAAARSGAMVATSASASSASDRTSTAASAAANRR